MEEVDRKHHSKRFRALVEDALDQASQMVPKGFDLGAIAVCMEVQRQVEDSGYKRRAAGGYTPGGDAPVASDFMYWCSDDRRWVQAAMLGDCYRYAQDRVDDPELDDEAELDEEPNQAS